MRRHARRHIWRPPEGDARARSAQEPCRGCVDTDGVSTWYEGVDDTQRNRECAWDGLPDEGGPPVTGHLY